MEGEKFDKFNAPKKIDRNQNSNVDKNEYKIEITRDDVIPQGEPLSFVKEEVAFSNNHKYKNKNEIEHSKKSHLEYLKIITQNKDPINVVGKGGLRPITMDEVEKHNSAGDLWTILNGKVYDLSIYLDYHPGGAKKLMLGSGKDCTDLFSIYLLND